MSTLTVTADPNFSSTTTISVHPESVMQRVRRALVMSGITALIIGAILGLIQANPSILVSRFGYEPHPLIVALVGGGTIGLVGGLIAGLALRGRTALLRWGVAMFALIVGLIVSEMVHGAAVGMSLDGALRATRDDVEAAQIGVGAMLSLIGSLAGLQKARRSPPISTGAIVAPPVAAPVVGWTRLRSQTSASSAAAGHVRSPRRLSRTPRPSRSSRKRSTSQVEITVPSAAAKPASRSRRSLLSRRHKVHLGKQATNVCPYCLEEVLPNDPRGKVVCDICGTPHHGDCWAITGKCEVPHLQT
jgi:hypothetical protein